MQLFYTQNIANNIAILGQEETRHCKVLRKNIGESIYVIDGKGNLYNSEINAIKKESIELKIISSEYFKRQRNYYFHLLIAPTKQNERMEWLLEKAIETGLDEITFIQIEHSEKARINSERLEKIAISAMKQSGEYYLPIINPIVQFSDVLKNINSSQLNLLAHCNKLFHKDSLKQILSQQTIISNIQCFIGPEGDFSKSEIELAYQQNFKGLSLGNSRLRTETAGLYCAMGLSNLLS